MGTDLLELIKQAGMEAVDAADPVRVMYGTVTSEVPLMVNIEQKMTLGAEFLILTDAVRDHTVEIALDGSTAGAGAHAHSASVDGKSGSTDTAGGHSHGLGRYSAVIHNDLRVGERVMLLRVQGGQKFLVLDRV